MTHRKLLIPEVGRSQRVEVLTTLKRSSAGGHTVRELAAHFGMSYMGVKAHCLQLEREGFLFTERRRKPVGRPELIYRLTPHGHAVFTQADLPGGEPAEGQPRGAARLAADLLEAVRRAYGPAAAEKLLFSVFARWTEDFRARLAGCGDLPGRAAGLVRLRDAEGYLATLHGVPEHLLPAAPAPTCAPVNRHRPLSTVGDRHPVATASTVHHASPPAAWMRAGVSPSSPPPSEVYHSGRDDYSPAPKDPSSPWCIVENGSPLEGLAHVFPIIGRLERELFEKTLGCPVRRTDESTPAAYRCVFELVTSA